MPHVIVKSYPGITEEQKAKIAQEITKVIMDVAGKSEASISIDIKDVAPEVWMDEVYNIEIKPNFEKLYKKSGY